jgi:hypothetical protein
LFSSIGWSWGPIKFHADPIIIHKSLAHWVSVSFHQWLHVAHGRWSKQERW